MIIFPLMIYMDTDDMGEGRFVEGDLFLKVDLTASRVDPVSIHAALYHDDGYDYHYLEAVNDFEALARVTDDPSSLSLYLTEHHASILEFATKEPPSHPPA